MVIIMTTMLMLFFRDLKVASRTSRTTLLALQVSAEQSVDNDNDDNYDDDDDAFLGLTHL